MIRYVSPPGVDVEVERNGHVLWEKHRSVVEIEPDHTVRFYREVLEVESGGSAREPVVLTGAVTQLDPGRRLAFRVEREDSGRGLRFDLVAGTGELIGEFFSEFVDRRTGIILAPEDGAPLFPAPLDPPSSIDRRAADSASIAAAAPTSSPVPVESAAAVVLFELEPGPPLDGAELTAARERINRHLRRHQGRASSLKLAELSPDQRAFLALLCSGPLAALEQDALDDLRDFYAAEPSRRISINVTSLTLPSERDGSWEIVLGESRWAGVVIVYRLEGWRVVDRTLVG